MKVLTRFVISAADESQFPRPGPPEIAFLGRSNVGKSSLINSLAGSKIAKTSSTPGRTRTINFFEVRFPGRPKPDLVFADLPGYGYARVPREMMEEWPKFIEPYLQRRQTLALCIALVDANVPPQKSDAKLLDFLRAHDKKTLVVATKADRVGTRLPASLKALQQELGTENILAYSSKGQIGHAELWAEIRKATVND
jgi:GTP-binding protein